MVGEPVQQRDGQALQAEDLDEQFRSGGVQRDNPNSSMISRLSWDRFRWKFSSRLSSLAPIGPLYLVFTGATPQRGYPAGVLRQHGAAAPPCLPHGRGVRRSWLETALFTAPAGNPHHL